MAKLLELDPAALAEAQTAAEWYSERDPRVAVRFAEELESALERVLEAPGRWPEYVHGTRRVLLKKYPFAVVYREEPTRILVVAVAHTRQRPGYWKSR
jgi:plasmid stabilization system protein ParE